MSDPIRGFREYCKGPRRNPLGIIALFIFLVYGFASLVTAFAGLFTAAERLPLIYFLVLFPVLVLGAFVWLVSKHSGQLYAPADFKDEENYVRMQLTAVASLARASAKDVSSGTESSISQLVEVVREATPARARSAVGWRNHVLWVDDRPDNNVYERQAFEVLGLTFTLAVSTKEALDYLSRQQFAAIISDMGRREGPREGHVLLDTLRKKGNQTPLFSTRLLMLPNISERRRNMAAKEVPTTRRSYFRWLLAQLYGERQLPMAHGVWRVWHYFGSLGTPRSLLWNAGSSRGGAGLTRPLT